MTLARRLAPLALAVLVGVALGHGCSSGPDDPSATAEHRRTTELPDPGDVLDEGLMLGLARAKNFHHKADVHLQDGNLELAMATLREILLVPFPDDSPEGEEVKLDARARLAKLLVTAGQVDEAMTVVTEGIAAATRQSYFLGNLHTVKGEVHEARAALADDADQARAERRAAIEAYDHANEIYLARQQELMKEVGR